MVLADETRKSAEEYESLARSEPTAEKRELLDTARALRRVASELDASATTVRQLDRG
jgi:hypothetical protein